jgi:hypothetical protein
LVWPKLAENFLRSGSGSGSGIFESRIRIRSNIVRIRNTDCCMPDEMVGSVPVHITRLTAPFHSPRLRKELEISGKLSPASLYGPQSLIPIAGQAAKPIICWIAESLSGESSAEMGNPALGIITINPRVSFIFFFYLLSYIYLPFFK